MPEPSQPVDIKSLTELWTALSERRARLASNKVKVEAELAARKNNLRRLMDECVAAGYDPNNLKEEIASQAEILRVKLNTMDADLTAAEGMMRPMLEEIRG